jgi:hypothetical protein
MAVFNLLELVEDRLAHMFIPMAQTGNCSSACRVKDFGTVFEEEIAAISAHGFFGHEAGVSMEDCACHG